MTRPLLFLLLLLSSLFGEVPDPQVTVIEAKVARYDGEHILLQGAVSLENSLGKVTANEARLTRDHEGRSNLDFPFAELTEEVTCHLSTGGLLKCHKVNLDYLAKKSCFRGAPLLHYEDARGTLFAHSATVEYEEHDQLLKPMRLLLVGEVQMIDKSARYALADSVEYLFEEELCIFRASEGNTVLFYDKEKDVALSANEIRARRTKEGLESLQGIGNVRFVLKEDEFHKLKSSFQW